MTDQPMLTRLESVIGKHLGRYASPALVKALARDVLETVREPTPLMSARGLMAAAVEIPGADPEGVTAISADHMAIYHAMIDAALSEPSVMGELV